MAGGGKLKGADSNNQRDAVSREDAPAVAAFPFINEADAVDASAAEVVNRRLSQLLSIAVYWPDMSVAGRLPVSQYALMDTRTDQDVLFLAAAESVVISVLERLGDNPEARYAYFRRLVGLSLEMVRECGGPPGPGGHVTVLHP